MLSTLGNVLIKKYNCLLDTNDSLNFLIKILISPITIIAIKVLFWGHTIFPCNHRDVFDFQSPLAAKLFINMSSLLAWTFTMVASINTQMIMWVK